MESNRTNQSQRSEEMTEFEAAQEQLLSDTVEMLLRVARRLKEPYQRQVLKRALESIEDEEAQPEDVIPGKEPGPADRVKQLAEQFKVEPKLGRESGELSIERVIERLKAMEGRVRAICDGLDIKTKAVITILQKLAEVDGLSDIEYRYWILGDVLNDKAFVDAALKELPEDDDLACLTEAYELAGNISQAGRDNHGTVLDDNGEKRRPDTKGPGKDPGPVERTEAIVKQWLLDCDYSTKLAAILLAEYFVADHGTEKLAQEIAAMYEDDILAVAESPDSRPNGISVKEIFLSGVVAESLLNNQLR